MDYYKTLMIARNASPNDIQQAYHELAVKHHPDANQGDDTAAERFKAINKAYQVLRDPAKRKEYDITLGGASGPAKSTVRPGPGRGPTSGPTDRVPTGNPLTDILGDMMGTARATAAGEAKKPGEASSATGPPTVEIELTTREALEGAVRTILVNNKRLRIKITIKR
jgi:molecular chaperone DnaJ